MPNMDGSAVLSKLKASKKTKDVPVIMAKAFADREYIAGAQKGGAIDYIIKPFDFAVLLEKIDRSLKSKRRQEALSY
jgi:putative two-component system response regulator